MTSFQQSGFSVAAALLLCACAASQPRTQTPTPREVNIEEPTVVTASAPAERAKLLPALPASVSPASPELACGYDLVDGVAQKLDRVAVPAVCTGLSDERALRGSVAHRSLAAAHLLTKVLERDDRERSITRALLALLIEVPLAQVIELARTGTGCDDKAYPEACAAQRALIDQQLGASFHATLYALHVCSA